MWLSNCKYGLGIGELSSCLCGHMLMGKLLNYAKLFLLTELGMKISVPDSKGVWGNYIR